MKVQIERVSKIEPFKPFNCVITFESAEESRKLLDILRKSSNSNILDLPDPLFLVFDRIKTEMVNQGFIEQEIFEE